MLENKIIKNLRESVTWYIGFNCINNYQQFPADLESDRGDGIALQQPTHSANH